MLSAERNSIIEIGRQQEIINQRIRNSLIPAGRHEWNGEEGDAEPAAWETKDSKFANQRTTSERKLFTKSILKNIQKFEIILDKRKKPEEIQEALFNFQRDSIRSLREGEAIPSIKKYVDLNLEAYEPGEEVTGHISVVLAKELQLENIVITIKGVYLVAFQRKTEGESTTGTEQITFLLEDATFKMPTNEILQAGSYQYTFKFKLPLNIPGTMFFERFQTVYEGASVVYSIEAILKLAVPSQEHIRTPVAKEIIEVMKKLPNRADDMFHKPCEVSKSNTLTFCCYSFGKMYLSVTLKKVLYHEGETMKISIELTNESKLKATEVITELIQNSAFKNVTQKGYVLKARTVLLMHKLSLQSIGYYGGMTNELELTLPDEMQASTVASIVPPSSFLQLKETAGSAPNTPKATSKEKMNEQEGVNEGADLPNIDAVKPEDVKLDDVTFLVLEKDYHNLYTVDYHLHIKLRSSSEWFNTKGPEIYFPITIESGDVGNRRERARQKGEIANTDDQESQEEDQ